MLSEDLKNTGRRYAAYLDTGLIMTESHVANLVSFFEAAATMARQLEAAQVPASARLTDDDLPANVINIARVLDRRGVRTGRDLIPVYGPKPTRPIPDGAA